MVDNTSLTKASQNMTSNNPFPNENGIVDGDRSNETVPWLVTHKNSRKSYKWFVTVLKGVLGVDRCHQLAHFNNHRHDKKLYIEHTFYD